MWIFTFLPTWVFHAVFLAGVLTMLAGIFFSFIPFISKYQIPVKVLGYVLLAFGLFFEGGLNNNAAWQSRVSEMELKVVAAEVESVKENTKIVEKVVRQTEIVRTKGRDVIQYIDREVTKYDSACIIPAEFIKAHNDAAEPVK
jgi:predicted membrane metal-binding protein